MFPSDSGPVHDASLPSVPFEVSPPASQRETSSPRAVLGGPGRSSDAMETAASTRDPLGGRANEARKKDEKDPPGWAWNNKRALEEYARAKDGMVDQKFSLREFPISVPCLHMPDGLADEFGDPFDEDDMKLAS